MAENNTKLDCLIRLQEKISEKLDQEKQKEIIPEKLGKDTAELNKAKAALEELNAQLEAAVESEKSLSIQYDDAFAKTQECQRRFEFASSQREFEALNKEHADAEDNFNQLRKLKNAKKDEITNISKSVADMTEHVNALQTEYDKESLEVDGKIEEINKKIELIDQEIESIKGDSVSDEYFTKLYNIAKKKGGIGLVPVYGQVCMGCNTVLPMQFVIDLRIKQHSGDIDTCSYCPRMIYYREDLPAEEEKNYLFDDFDAARNSIKASENSDESADESDDILEAEDLGDDF
ncbi:MAG: zinc ribbon domain-containing protein [Candidatus Ornithospirochaeta sp.]